MAGAEASRSSMNHSRLTLGRIGSVRTVGWEAQYGLVPGIGGTGTLGEGWESAPLRPEVTPPDFDEISPDIDIVYAIRSRRAERLMASHANIPNTVHSQTQHYLGVVTKGKSPLKDAPVVAPTPRAADGHVTVLANESKPPAASTVDDTASKDTATITSGKMAMSRRARSGSVSVETAEALASALAGSARGEMEAQLEELTHSESDGDSSEDEDLEYSPLSRPRKRSRVAPEYYW